MNADQKLDLLMLHCADLGIDVSYGDLGATRHGEYHHPDRIILNRRNRMDQTLSALAHELGHAVGCENGATANCGRADEYGAAIVIAEDEPPQPKTSLASTPEPSPDTSESHVGSYSRGSAGTCGPIPLLTALAT